jgi:hypothetical protein
MQESRFSHTFGQSACRQMRGNTRDAAVAQVAYIIPLLVCLLGELFIHGKIQLASFASDFTTFSFNYSDRRMITQYIISESKYCL